MFRTLRAQIALLAIIPVLGLLAIGTFSLARPFGIMSQATILLPLTDAAGTAGNIVNEVLRETDATAAALAGKRKAPRSRGNGVQQTRRSSVSKPSSARPRCLASHRN
jgi:hypothetical protein